MMFCGGRQRYAPRTITHMQEGVVSVVFSNSLESKVSIYRYKHKGCAFLIMAASKVIKSCALVYLVLRQALFLKNIEFHLLNIQIFTTTSCSLEESPTYPSLLLFLK